MDSNTISVHSILRTTSTVLPTLIVDKIFTPVKYFLTNTDKVKYSSNYLKIKLTAEQIKTLRKIYKHKLTTLSGILVASGFALADDFTAAFKFLKDKEEIYIIIPIVLTNLLPLITHKYTSEEINILNNDCYFVSNGKEVFTDIQGKNIFCNTLLKIQQLFNPEIPVKEALYINDNFEIIINNVLIKNICENCKLKNKIINHVCIGKPYSKLLCLKNINLDKLENKESEFKLNFATSILEQLEQLEVGAELEKENTVQ